MVMIDEQQQKSPRNIEVWDKIVFGGKQGRRHGHVFLRLAVRVVCVDKSCDAELRLGEFSEDLPMSLLDLRGSFRLGAGMLFFISLEDDKLGEFIAELTEMGASTLDAEAVVERRLETPCRRRHHIPEEFLQDFKLIRLLFQTLFLLFQL